MELDHIIEARISPVRHVIVEMWYYKATVVPEAQGAEPLAFNLQVQSATASGNSQLLTSDLEGRQRERPLSAMSFGLNSERPQSAQSGGSARCGGVACCCCRG